MSSNTSMSVIVARENGTIRFGHALRQLGRQNLAEWRDILDELESTRSQTHLLRTLAKANQACLLAKAKNSFMVVPNDDDISILLDDIATFGPQEIAALLIILSTLYYPTAAEQEENVQEGHNNEQGVQPHD